MTCFRSLTLASLVLFGVALAVRAADEPATPATPEAATPATPEATAPAATETEKPAAAEAEAGLIASWKFDEGEGTTVKDSAGKNDGKITGAKWVDGKFGKALDFDGQSTWVEIPDAPALNLTKAVTIEAWVKHRGNSISTWETILAKGDSAYRLHFDETDQGFGMGLTDANGFWNMSSGVKPDPDKWYFVVATFDGKEACVYVDGKKTASLTEGIPASISTDSYGVCIGDNNEATGRYFNGIIDEVKLYDRALSAEEIAKQYGAATKEPGLVASWKFDEGEGTEVKDSAGKNNGKITGAKWVDGKVGKALDFDGQGAFVEIPNAPALDLTKALTIEAWVKHRGNTIYTWETILAKGDSAYRLHFDETDQGFGLGLTDSSGFWNMSSGVTPDPDKWYFVVATYDGKEACVYVDGKKSATATDCPASISTDSYGVCIGDNNEATGRYFNGIIDEVKLYDRALSAEEIAKQFEAVK